MATGPSSAFLEADVVAYAFRINFFISEFFQKVTLCHHIECPIDIINSIRKGRVMNYKMRA